MWASRPKVAVVGHVEWVQFARVPHVPRAGEVVHAREPFEEPAGGGAVAAVQLARLTGEATLLTALGDDELARRSIARLQELGVDAFSTRTTTATRRAATLVDGPASARSSPTDRAWSRGGRTGAAVGGACPDGRRLLHRRRPRRAARRTGGAGARRQPARGRVLGHGVELDALVLSGEDEIERRQAERVEAQARLVVSTDGARGGVYREHAGGSGRGPRRSCPARRSTPTAVATRSRRGSPTGSAPVSSCRPRWRWPRVAGRCA